MENKVIYQLARENSGMSTVDRLVNMYHLLSQVLYMDIEGDIVELGCNKGKTSVFFKMLLNKYKSSKKLHLYDSFQGLPKQGIHDQYLNEGDCKALVEEVYENFSKWELEYPEIHPGWFNETLPHKLPEKISFAYLDSDFYDPILLSLKSIYPRLTKGAIVVIDDYGDKEKAPKCWEGLPGVKIACDQFFENIEESPTVLIGESDLSMCYFIKE